MTIQRWDFVIGGDCTGGSAGDDNCGMYPAKNGKYVATEDHEREVAELKQLLREFYKNTGIIDNGYCAVCKHGYRKWKLPKCDVPDGPCSNEECLSRRTDEVLGVKP